jgi:hypothetical protein
VTAFEALLAEATAGAGRFGHREHVRLTWLAVTRFGVAAAVDLVGGGIERVAPGKYHATLTRAWVEVVGRHVAEAADPDFDAFLARCPDLLDKRLLDRHYRPATLAAAAARTGWVPPDLRPL